MARLISILRTSRDETLDRLALKLGIAQTTLSKIFSELIKPTPEQQSKLEKHFGLIFATLMTPAIIELDRDGFRVKVFEPRMETDYENHLSLGRKLHEARQRRPLIRR